MANPYVRSIIWLTSFTSLGYALLVICTPSESDIKKLKQTLPGAEKTKSEVLKKREQYFETLQAAAIEKPIYLRTKDELKNKKDI